jgi:hypothetical protein
MLLRCDRQPGFHAPDVVTSGMACVGAISHDSVRHTQRAFEQRNGRWQPIPLTGRKALTRLRSSAITQALVLYITLQHRAYPKGVCHLWDKPDVEFLKWRMVGFRKP